VKNRDNAPVIVDGVTITNPDRVLYAEQGITKRTLAEYYVQVVSRMLPHVVDRPLSLVRCPQGQGGTCFYQKHWPNTLPAGVDTVDVREESGKREPYVVVRDGQGLVSLVQHGVLEVHTWGARADDIEHPDRVVFDLDPAPDVPWNRVVATARRLRALLTACGLTSWVKTTGGKGLHVVLPIAPDISWSDLHDFVRLATARLVADDPHGLIDTASKSARTGRIYIDYLRNGRGATAVAPWSTRAREGAPIAVPISWTQLERLDRGNGVSVADAGAWLSRFRDPWVAMLRHEQHVTEAVMAQLLMEPRPRKQSGARGRPAAAATEQAPPVHPVRGASSSPRGRRTR
jgi:bifunctional non-homologous end joining protein LigD